MRVLFNEDFISNFDQESIAFLSLHLKFHDFFDQVKVKVIKILLKLIIHQIRIFKLVNLF